MDQDPERNKLMVRRWVDEVINGGDLAVLEEICSPDLAARARRWVAPFRASFSDIEMRTVELVAERETVVGRFLCSGTHTGDWLGGPPTGRRFEDVDEVYFFRFTDGLITHQWGLEDSRTRMRQLGLSDRDVDQRS